MTVRQMLVELNENQIYMLERVISECVIGADEQTPEAFTAWQNYTAESPTVAEHYRIELRASQREALSVLFNGTGK